MTMFGGLPLRLGAALCVAAFAPGCGSSVDRSSYIAQNLALIRGVPAVPGSRLVRVDETGYKNGEAAWATTVGYGTLQVYPGFQLNFTRGDAYLEVFATQRHVEVKNDHNCYKGGSSPVCFGL